MSVAVRLRGLSRRRRRVTASTSSNESNNDDSGCIWRALCCTLAWNRFSPTRTSWLPAPEATRSRAPHGGRSGSQSSSLSSSVLLSVVVLRGDLFVEPDSARRPATHAGRARPGADLIRYRREPTFEPHDADQHVTGDVDGASVEFRSLNPARCWTVIALGHRVLLSRERISTPNRTSGYTLTAVLRRVATRHGLPRRPSVDARSGDVDVTACATFVSRKWRIQRRHLTDCRASPPRADRRPRGSPSRARQNHRASRRLLLRQLSRPSSVARI